MNSVVTPISINGNATANFHLKRRPHKRRLLFQMDENTQKQQCLNPVQGQAQYHPDSLRHSALCKGKQQYRNLHVIAFVRPVRVCLSATRLG